MYSSTSSSRAQMSRSCQQMRRREATMHEIRGVFQPAHRFHSFVVCVVTLALPFIVSPVSKTSTRTSQCECNFVRFDSLRPIRANNQREQNARRGARVCACVTASRKIYQSRPLASADQRRPTMYPCCTSRQSQIAEAGL